jgi:alkylation response protein AidB-like acyl-CoA dehydrogenase
VDQNIQALLKNQIRPEANLIDHDIDAMRRAMKVLEVNQLLGLRRPLEYGGPELPEAEFRRYQEEVARASGALAFLQTQHQSAVSMLARHAKPELKARLLPNANKLGGLIGLGFSQLRRPGAPICTAEETKEGYKINGHIPWITGLGFFNSYILGATLASGEAVFGIVPLKSVPGQTLSQPMQLCAMEAAQTVTAELNQYSLSHDDVAFVKPPGWMRANDAFNIVLQGHFAIGCALAGTDIVGENAAARRDPELKDFENILRAEVLNCANALRAAQVDTSEEGQAERLSHRAWAVELMGRCAQAAIISSGGSANSVSHAAQRVLRESIVFAVSAQTSAIMRASLKRLVR